MKRKLIGFGILVVGLAAFLCYFLGVPNIGKLGEVFPGTYQREIHQVKSPDDVLIVGVGLLGSYSKSFYTYDIPSNLLTDVTDVLLPIWDGSDEAKNYRNSDWYRMAIR